MQMHLPRAVRLPAGLIAALVALLLLAALDVASHLRPSSHQLDGWTAFDGGPSHNAVVSPTAGSGQRFFTKLPGGVVGGLSWAGGVLYGGGLDGSVFAMSARSGKLLWITHLPNSVFCPPSVVGSRVFVGIGNDIFSSMRGSAWIRGTPPSGVYALDRKTCRILWSLPTVGNDKTTPLYDPATKLLYEPDGSHWLRAIRPATGKVVWRVYDGGINDFSNPALVGGVLYIDTGMPGHPGLRAFSARTGRHLWTLDSTNADNAPTLGAGDLLAVNTLPVTIHGKQLLREVFRGVSLTGQPLWSYTTAPGPYPPAYQAPAATFAGGSFYVASSIRSRLYAFSARTGRLLWKAKLSGPAYDNPAVLAGEVVVATVSGRLYALRRSDGQPLGSVQLPGTVGAGGILIAHNTVYVGLIRGTAAQIVSGGAPSGGVAAVPLSQLTAASPGR